MRAGFLLHAPVGGHHRPVARSFTQGNQPAGNRLVGGAVAVNEMHGDTGNIPFSRAAGGSLVKKNFHWSGFGAQEGAQQCKQALFIIHLLQAHTGQLGDQVVSVNEVRHGFILHSNCAMILSNMRRPVRILPFLILNIIVSAGTVLAVLYWWNSTRPPAPLPPVVFPTENAPLAATPQSTASPLPAESRPLQVVDVIGAGDVKNEVVQLKNTSEGEFSLAGWKLEDGQGHRYSFPNFTLGKGGVVRIYTRAGLDSATELFWGLAEPAWQKGKTITIFDAKGSLRASFIVP